jgi:hypothetical protein
MKLLFALGLMPSLLLLVAGCSGEEKKPAATASGSQTTQTTLHSFPPHGL